MKDVLHAISKSVKKVLRNVHGFPSSDVLEPVCIKTASVEAPYEDEPMPAVVLDDHGTRLLTGWTAFGKNHENLLVNEDGHAPVFGPGPVQFFAL